MEDGSNRFVTGFIPLLFFHGVVVLIAITALVIIIPPLIQKIKKITKKS